MTELHQKQSQIRAQKLNLGAVQKLERRLIRLQKDRKKAMQNVDQEIIDSRRFLDYVQSSSGNSITREEAYPSSSSGINRTSIIDSSSARVKPTRSAVMKLEVQLQKALAQSRFKHKSEDFFIKWKDMFDMHIDLDTFLISEEELSLLE